MFARLDSPDPRYEIHLPILPPGRGGGWRWMYRSGNDLHGQQNRRHERRLLQRGLQFARSHRGGQQYARRRCHHFQHGHRFYTDYSITPDYRFSDN